MTANSLTGKNFDIWNAVVDPTDPSKPGALIELVAIDTPLPESNTLRRSLRLAREAFGDLDAERAKIIEKHAKKDADGRAIKTADGKGVELADIEAFKADLAVLMDQEVVLVGAKTVNISALGTIKFAGEKLDRLSLFVVDDA